MAVFEHASFDAHEQVVFCSDPEAGLRAIIAIHNTALGPALGGCRMWPYASGTEALTDVLRLSRGMSYKSAISNLALGGGKSVIIGDPRRDKTDALLRAMGRSIDRLAGRYIGAEDSGTSVPDLRLMGEETRYVAGVAQHPGFAGGEPGDPSPATAYGVFAGLRAAVGFALGREDLEGVKVAMQGLGNVGMHLARALREAGARLWVTDIDSQRVQRAADELDAVPVATDAIFEQPVDVFAPCALGASINQSTLPRLRARIVAGSANNQLADERRDGSALRRRGILYAPDYVINAGGIIDISYHTGEYDPERARAHVESIHATLMEIFQRAEREALPTHVVADRMAEERLYARQLS